MNLPSAVTSPTIRVARVRERLVTPCVAIASRLLTTASNITRFRSLTVAVLIAGIVSLTGCEQQRGGSDSIFGTHKTEGSLARLPGVAPDQAFDAGIYAMHQWFRIADAQRPQGVIRSAATEYDQKGGTGRIRDAVGYRNRMRRTATISIRQEAGGTAVECTVTVQRLDTSDHRTFHEQRHATDYPSETPIDREAGVSASQDQVWTDMPSDRQLEREILDVIRNRLKDATQATSRPS